MSFPISPRCLGPPRAKKIYVAVCHGWAHHYFRDDLERRERLAGAPPDFFDRLVYIFSPRPFFWALNFAAAATHSAGISSFLSGTMMMPLCCGHVALAIGRPALFKEK
jgi:hypothetical protein